MDLSLEHMATFTRYEYDCRSIPGNRLVAERGSVKSIRLGVRLQLAPGIFSETSFSIAATCSSLTSCFRSILHVRKRGVE